jgi:hypothetical protein
MATVFIKSRENVARLARVCERDFQSGSKKLNGAEKAATGFGQHTLSVARHRSKSYLLESTDVTDLPKRR